MKSWEEVRTGPLVFPIGGKEYVVPEIPYDIWLQLQYVQAGRPSTLGNADSDDALRTVLGTAWDEMVADNVPAEALSRAGLAALADIQLGREMAESVWEAGLDPKAVAAVVQARETPPTPPTPTTSPSTASASGTPSPASTTRTTSRKTSSTKKKARRAPSSSSSTTTGR